MIREQDTITAIATPFGESAIGIIRLSGPDAIKIAGKIFYPYKKINLRNALSHSIIYGKIKDKKQIIDNVLVLLMKNPGSYTGEDSIEISAHGNPLILNKILNLLLNNGARLAMPGEFTKRAFLNGKIDLLQAESVLDIIHAKTQKALDASLRQLTGEASNKFSDISNCLMDLLMHLEIDIDFTEENIPSLTQKQYESQIKNIISQIKLFIDSYDITQLLRQGINIVITGAPNTGKSSLLNAILKTSVAIVTDIPGTTRDALLCPINLNGFPCNIIDTAGLRDAEDFIEKQGIEKTKEHIKRSHIVLFLCDASREFSQEEKKEFKKILELEKEKNIIVGINKIDILNTKHVREIKEFFKDIYVIEFSAKTLENISVLEQKIVEAITHGQISFTADFMINIRHKNILENILNRLERVFSITLCGKQDIISFEIKECLNLIGEITGKVSSDDILNKIFENFCIGK